MSMFVTFSFVC